MAEHAEVYQDADGRYRWRYVSSNGRTMADSGQGYVRRDDCLYGLEVVTGLRVLYQASGHTIKGITRPKRNPVPVNGEETP